MRRVRVAVIGGGQNYEHDVSVASAASVRSALDGLGHDVVALTIGRDGAWRGGRALSLPEVITVLQSCDVVFPAVHGPRGEDGSLAALLEFAGVRYVGSGVGAGALGMDKWATKLVAEAVGVRTARGDLVTAGGVLAVELPVVVKPVAGGSSFGVSRADDAAGLDTAIAAALAMDDRVLVEQVVVGREVDIAVLARADGSRLLSAPLEIVAPGLFDTATKYDGSADFRVPAVLQPEDLVALEAAALAVFDAIGCAGVARVDFFLTDHGPVLNEVNTMPGMTAASQVPRMYAAVGLEYPALLEELLTAALA